jgi:hypothetical protein
MSAKANRELSLAQWADNQRALARSLGLSIEEWMGALDQAAKRQTGVYAAVVGAAMARGLGLAVLEQLDQPELARRARALIDPKPPRTEHPLLAEAIRRADELGVRPGRGAGRLKRPTAETSAPSTPARVTKPLGISAEEATPDAPGRPAAPARSKPRSEGRTKKRGSGRDAQHPSDSDEGGEQ